MGNEKVITNYVKNQGDEYSKIYRTDYIEGQMSLSGMLWAQSANNSDTPLSWPSGARRKASAWSVKVQVCCSRERCWRACPRVVHFSGHGRHDYLEDVTRLCEAVWLGLSIYVVLRLSSPFYLFLSALMIYLLYKDAKVTLVSFWGLILSADLDYLDIEMVPFTNISILFPV